MAAMVVPPFAIDDTGLTEAQVEQEKFEHCIFKILKVFGEPGALDPTSVSTVVWNSNYVVMALDYEGVYQFSELLALGPEAILNLVAPVHRFDGALADIPEAKLRGLWTRKLRTLTAY